MNFRPRKKRSTPGVIIVSLIDVLMVVLIFLVVTTTFKDRLPAVDLSLPATRHVDGAVQQDNGPLIINIRPYAPQLRLGENSVTLPELRRKFTAAQKDNPAVPLIIRADKQAPFGIVIDVRDAAHQAGITNINAQVKIPSGR